MASWSLGQEKRVLKGLTAAARYFHLEVASPLLKGPWPELITQAHLTTGGPRSVILLCASNKEPDEGEHWKSLHKLFYILGSFLDLR